MRYFYAQYAGENSFLSQIDAVEIGQGGGTGVESREVSDPSIFIIGSL